MVDEEKDAVRQIICKNKPELLEIEEMEETLLSWWDDMLSLEDVCGHFVSFHVRTWCNVVVLTWFPCRVVVGV